MMTSWEAAAQKALHCIAANASAWVYHTPEDLLEEAMPTRLREEDSGHEFSIRYKSRKLFVEAGTEQSHKATFEAELEPLEGQERRRRPIRVLGLVFRGTVSVMDVMASLGVIMNEERFAKQGICVQSCWHAMVDNPQRTKDMKDALLCPDANWDWVLLCGHSLGGALAQIAALLLHVELQQEQRNMVKRGRQTGNDFKVACVTFAGPTPFAPLRAEQLESSAQGRAQAASLKWLQDHCTNYVNNNDLVPRLLSNVDYVVESLSKCGRLYLCVGPPVPGLKTSLADINPREVAQYLESKTGILSLYRPTATMAFIGHTKGQAEKFAPSSEDCRAALRQRIAEDVRHHGKGLKDHGQNWYSGGLKRALADHDMQVYIEMVYKSLRMHGWSTSKVWGYDLEAWTQDRLHIHLKELGLPLKGNKQDRVNRLRDHYLGHLRRSSHPSPVPTRLGVSTTSSAKRARKDRGPN